MPALANDRYEQFAIAVARGVPLITAAKQNGYSPKSAAIQGTRMAARPAIAARIAELKAEAQAARIRAVEHTDLTRGSVLARLDWIAQEAEKQRNLPILVKVAELQGREVGMFSTRIEAKVEEVNRHGGMTAVQALARMAWIERLAMLPVAHEAVAIEAEAEQAELDASNSPADPELDASNSEDPLE